MPRRAHAQSLFDPASTLRTVSVAIVISCCYVLWKTKEGNGLGEPDRCEGGESGDRWFGQGRPTASPNPSLTPPIQAPLGRHCNSEVASRARKGIVKAYLLRIAERQSKSRWTDSSAAVSLRHPANAAISSCGSGSVSNRRIAANTPSKLPSDRGRSALRAQSRNLASS